MGDAETSHRMEMLGRLAAGIAHDFNNLLTAITAYSELLLQRTRDNPEIHQEVQEIRKVAERAAALTRQILSFSRSRDGNVEALNLNDIIRDMLPMLRQLLGPRILCLTRLQSDLGCIKANRSQIEQVLLNLAVNARDAMPHGGQLCIDASSDRSKVRLQVQDTGQGMDEETRAHLFEPLYSTKRWTVGTGLGLATVFEIVRRSGGSIEVDTAPGKGTRFTLEFPRIEDESENSTVIVPRQATRSGSERILLVEDEESIRHPIRTILRLQGYEVLTASSGEEAIQACASRAEPIHLMLTDILMPRMNGHELARRVAPLRPEMKILFMSGHQDSTLLRHRMLHTHAHFIQKPFTIDALASKVREVLDSR
jgi:CheY-like chemotaxis protein